MNNLRSASGEYLRMSWVNNNMYKEEKANVVIFILSLTWDQTIKFEHHNTTYKTYIGKFLVLLYWNLNKEIL